MTISLSVTSRTKGAAIDREAHVAGVVYGPKQESMPLAVDRRAFEKLYKEAGESTIFTLDGLGGEPLEVLVHDVDLDPILGTIRHVDFYAFERGKEITVTVPLEFTGEAPAEEKEAVITKVLHEVEVTCRPSKLPHSITVDLSALAEVDDQIKIKDLALPDGVVVENNPDDVVALAAAFVEEPEEPTEAPDMDAIEVEAKGKEEEESTEGAEAKAESDE